MATLKTIGLLGGMSSVATGEYYRLLNQLSISATGRAPQIAMFSVDFAHVGELIRDRDWDKAATFLTDRARRVQAAGADFLLLATNTMHVIAPQIDAALEIPLVHIVDVTAAAAIAERSTTLGVLGTKPVMQPGFYTERFASHGIELMAPTADDQQLVESIIFNELTRNIVRDNTTIQLLRIVEHFINRGAQGVVLGCTELSLALTSAAAPTAIYDTTQLHVEAAIRLATEPGSHS